MDMVKVLLIEDDKNIRDIITTYFKKRDLNVIEAMNGHDGLSKMDSSIDLVLLDIMMPGIDGLEVCFQIRQKYSCPIIFISALSKEETQLKAFELGADDYVSKPFLPSVLYAKCSAIIKRITLKQSDVKVYGNIKVDYLNQQVWVNEELISLTHKEYLLLELFTKNHNLLLPREQILDSIWGYDYYGEARVVDSFVKKLRKKLGEASYYIQTVFKVGYRFVAGDNNEENV